MRLNDKLAELQQNVMIKIAGKQRNAVINKCKSKIKKLIKSKRLEYLQGGKISYKEDNGKMWIGSGKEIAKILLDKDGRSPMEMLGIFEDDIAEIIINKGE